MLARSLLPKKKKKYVSFVVDLGLLLSDTFVCRFLLVNVPRFENYFDAKIYFTRTMEKTSAIFDQRTLLLKLTDKFYGVIVSCIPLERFEILSNYRALFIVAFTLHYNCACSRIFLVAASGDLNYSIGTQQMDSGCNARRRLPFYYYYIYFYSVDCGRVNVSDFPPE